MGALSECADGGLHWTLLDAELWEAGKMPWRPQEEREQDDWYVPEWMTDLDAMD